MRSIDPTDKPVPLGAPLNRPPAAGPRPILGRPGWVQHNGKEYYVEPPRPPQPVLLMPTEPMPWGLIDPDAP